MLSSFYYPRVINSSVVIVLLSRIADQIRMMVLAALDLGFIDSGEFIFIIPELSGTPVNIKILVR